MRWIWGLGFLGGGGRIASIPKGAVAARMERYQGAPDVPFEGRG
jgi:hypothetical protein